jgi:hypothetical protein
VPAGEPRVPNARGRGFRVGPGPPGRSRARRFVGSSESRQLEIRSNFKLNSLSPTAAAEGRTAYSQAAAAVTARAGCRFAAARAVTAVTSSHVTGPAVDVTQRWTRPGAAVSRL